MRKLKQLQRRVSIWILPHIIDYKERLTVLELLPIPLYLQLLDILTLSKICNGQYTISPEDYVELRHGPQRESRMIPISRQPRLELSHQEFFIRTSRLLRFMPSIDVTKPIGLKPILLRLFWNHFDTNYTENNLCSWRIGCRCSGCCCCCCCCCEFSVGY